MNKMKLISGALLGTLLLVSIQACTDHFDAINTSPTLVGSDVVNPDMLFAQSVRSGVYQIPSYSGTVKEWTGYAAYPHTANPFQHANFGSPWGMYTNQIVAISDMLRLTQDDPYYANHNAMARIWRVWLFHQITDHYGDIPYFEAALAQEDAVSHPRYDTQREIYVDMLEQLKQAAADLQVDPARGDIGRSDLIYNGDVELWTRFANSLRLRLALRVRYADESLASEHISDVINEPLIEDNSQNAYIMTLPDGTEHTSNRHPMFNENINPLNPIQCTHLLVTSMREVTADYLDMDDPRLPVLCQPAELDGEYRGRVIDTPHGMGWFFLNENVSRVNERVVRAEQPIMVLDHAEVAFSKAEIYLAGLAGGDAEAAYREGIRASMEFYEVDEADITAFLSGSAGTLSGSEEDMLQQIATQKWLSLYQQTAEGFSEMRRTGYPMMYTYPADPGNTNRRVPRRTPYPLSEYQRNQANNQEAIDRLGGDDALMARIWWDAKPGLPYLHPDDADELFPPRPDEDVTEDDFNPGAS